VAKHVERALVEAEVVYGADDFAAIDQEHAITRDTGKQQAAVINFSNVPQTVDQQPILDASYHLIQSSTVLTPIENQVVNRRRDDVPGGRRRMARVH
jgi:hypothetical protein